MMIISGMMNVLTAKFSSTYIRFYWHPQSETTIESALLTSR